MKASNGRLPLKGIYRDSLLRNHPTEYSPDVVNMVVNQVTGSYNTEPGNEIVSSIAVTNNLTINGIKTLIDGRKILMSIDNNDGLSEIGILDNDYNYSVRVHQDLGFNINFPFKPNNLQVEYNIKGELILAFTDNNQTPKIVNLDVPPSPFTIGQIELFPRFKNPIVLSDVIENGGSLLSGTYYPVFHYKNNDGTETSHTPTANPIYITSGNGSSFNAYGGSAAGAPTSKGIRITLTNVDTTYDKIVLSIIYKKGGVFLPVEVKELSTGSTVVFNYSGTENTTDVNLSSVLISTAVYNRIAHFTQVQGTLYGADVGESNPINLQKYASLITLRFKSELLEVQNLPSSYKVNAQNNRKKAYAHQEVYAFYLIAKLKSGGWTQAVHIPGRPSTSIEGSISGLETDTNLSLLVQDSTLSADIAVDAGSKYFQTRDTTRDINTGNFTGKLGFWENENETYPNLPEFDSSAIGGEDLRGKKVRHHRFPSLSKCKSAFYSGVGDYGVVKWDALSIVIDNFPTIPSDILDQIEGFEIVYAKRSTGDSTVIGQDIVLNGGTRAGDFAIPEPNRVVYNSGGNWDNTQAGSHGTDINNEYITHNGNSLRLHSFDLLYEKPAIKPSYMCNHLLLQLTNIASTKSITRGKEVYSYLLDYANADYYNAGSLNVVPVPEADARMFAIKDFRYIPANVIDNNVNNYRGEEHAYARISNGANRIVGTQHGMYLEEVRDTTLSFEQTYLTTLMIYKIDMYSSFYNQNLATTGIYFLPNAIPSNIYGGDIFISKYGFLSYSPRLLRDIPGSVLPYSGPISYYAGVKVCRAFLCESVNNIGFRNEIGGNEQTKYYPKQTISGDATWFVYLDMTVNPNSIAYNKDYSSVNDLNPFIPINPYNEFISNHPHRIIRSIPYSATEQAASWRNFLVNDYYELRKDKGRITAIQGINDDLLINLETTILKTRGNEVLRTGELETFVGSGDIFKRPPIELITAEKGYGGCQHTFSCILTPMGYFFVDANARKVFLYTDKLEDISNGLHNYFLDNIRSVLDNPYLSTGFTSTWDEEYDRIVFSQLDINLFTWSYTPMNKSWTSRHLYEPEILFNDRNTFFSLKEGVIYKHNANNKAKYYGEIKPSSVVIISRDVSTNNPLGPSVESTYSNVNWKTDIILDGIKKRNLTINKLLIWNSYQSTGNIDIIPFNREKGFEQNEGYNTRTIKDRWFFSKFRDLVENIDLKFIEDYSSIESNINQDKDFILKKRFSDDFLAIKILFSNELIGILQPDCFLTDIDTEQKIVSR